MTKCYKDNATSLEHPSCDNQQLTGDGWLSSGYRIYVKCYVCFDQNIEVVVDTSGALMWGVIRMSNTPIGGACESAFPAGPVDEEVYSAWVFTGFLQTGVGHSRSREF